MIISHINFQSKFQIELASSMLSCFRWTVFFRPEILYHLESERQAVITGSMITDVLIGIMSNVMIACHRVSIKIAISHHLPFEALSNDIILFGCSISQRMSPWPFWINEILYRSIHAEHFDNDQDNDNIMLYSNVWSCIVTIISHWEVSLFHSKCTCEMAAITFSLDEINYRFF